MENKILAEVNGRKITEMDLKEAMAKFPEDKQRILCTEEGKKQLLNQMISFELIYDYAKDSNIENEEEYKLQLQSAQKDVLTQYTITKVISGITISDKEAEEYYDLNKAMFKGEESVSARHILVDSEEKAENVKKEINGGLSFEDAAMKYSSCPSKEQGGYLGNFTRGKMVPEFEKAAFSLEVNKVSEPVKTQFGYHLIKVESKEDAKEKSFEEVKSYISNMLLQEKQGKIFTDLVSNLKDKYKVKLEE